MSIAYSGVIWEELSVDVSRANEFSPRLVKQGDAHTRGYIITLTKNGEKLNIPTANTTAWLNCRNQSDPTKKASASGTILDDGTVLVLIPTVVMEVAGYVQCDISVITASGNDTNILKSTLFYLSCEAAANPNGTSTEAEDNILAGIAAGTIAPPAAPISGKMDLVSSSSLIPLSGDEPDYTDLSFSGMASGQIFKTTDSRVWIKIEAGQARQLDNNILNETALNTTKATNNLWVFSNTASRTNRGLDVSFENGSTIKVDGTSQNGGALFAACGSSSDKRVPSGTYIAFMDCDKHDDSMTGTMDLYYSYNGSTWNQITLEQSFTLTESAYVLFGTLTGGKTYDATYHIKLIPYANVSDWTGFYPNQTAIDYEARNKLQKKVLVPLEPGSINRYNGSTTLLYSNFWNYRTTPLISVSGNTFITIDAADENNISFFNIYEYNENTEDVIAFVQPIRELHFFEGTYYYKPSSASVRYIRITLVLSMPGTTKLKPLIVRSMNGNEVCKNPNITDGSKIPLTYIVDGDTYTSGQLLLPPNYSIHRKAVPLIVVLHGTSSMNEWDQEIGTNSGTSTRYLLDYLTNEGFAVFDCYVFTSKYYYNGFQNQAAPIPIFLQAYTSGIKHVCDNFNVDIDNVFFYSMSAGGNLAFMIMQSCSDIKPKAMALLCPGTGFASTIFRTFFLYARQRRIVLDYLGLSEETGASHFIATTYGLDDTDACKFVTDHLDKFATMICGALGVHGATYKQKYEWSITGVTTLPQWMQDLNLPGIASGWTTSPATGIPGIVNHPELSAYTPIPTKFWQAFDDVNVSGHANFTIYQWLMNGGSNVSWRTMPNETGGHHAVDTDPNALKSSGTTRLNVQYTDIATAYVEMADFFYQHMAQ